VSMRASTANQARGEGCVVWRDMLMRQAACNGRQAACNGRQAACKGRQAACNGRQAAYKNRRAVCNGTNGM